MRSVLTRKSVCVNIKLEFKNPAEFEHVCDWFVVCDTYLYTKSIIVLCSVHRSRFTGLHCVTVKLVLLVKSFVILIFR